MKYIIAIVFVFIVFASSSCKKSPLIDFSNQNFYIGNDSSLIGKWNILNDSTSLQGIGPLQKDIHSNYIGAQTDYYNFTSEGNLYVKEGTNLDTCTYTFVSSNQINIVGFYVNGTEFLGGASMGTYVIEGLTENSVTLKLSELTPDGKEIVIINLKK
jgi:hypothetical protein